METVTLRTHVLRRKQLVAAPPDDVFAFFSVARNLERITPPFLSFEVLTPEPIAFGQGTLIDYRLRVHGIPMRWRSRIDVWEPGRRFVDRQLVGPYAFWHHLHEFEPDADGAGTIVRDTVHYRLPLGVLGAPALPFVRRDLRRIFDHRHQVVAELAAAGALATAGPS